VSATLLNADTLSSFLQAYKSGDSELTCTYGRDLYRTNIRDENILIAIGQACAQVDFIDFIGVLQQRLGKSSESRKAAVYFSSLVLQKRLISQFMHEDIDLTSYALPVTDHVLSRVFEAIKNGEYRLVSNNPKHIQIGTEEEFLDVYTDKKICVDHYKDHKKIKEHRYR
jgi:hypothetical protein